MNSECFIICNKSEEMTHEELLQNEIQQKMTGYHYMDVADVLPLRLG